MPLGSYTCWFEVTGLSAGREWVRFDRTQEYQPGAQECNGVFVDFDCYRDPVALAVDELEHYLPDIVSAEPVEVTWDGCGPDVERRLQWSGVRVRVWNTDDMPDGAVDVPEEVAGDPVALVRATVEQMSIGRLAAAANEVLAAQHQLDAARIRLRGQIVAAADVGVGRNHIARATERALSRRLVLQHLAAQDLRRQAARALPKDVASQVLLAVGTGDEVTLRVPHAGPAGPSDADDLAAGQPPADGQEDRAHDHALAVAEAALAALRSRLLEVRTSDGHEATANYLAGAVTGPRPAAVITRHPRAPRGHWEGPTGPDDSPARSGGVV